MEEAGIHGVVEVESVRWNATSASLLIEGISVIATGKDVGMIIGAPRAWTIPPVPVIERREYQGIPFDDNMWQYVPGGTCGGACQNVDVDVDSYEGGSFATCCNPGQCVIDRYPVPDFEDASVKHAQRGAGKECMQNDDGTYPNKSKRYVSVFVLLKCATCIRAKK
jgi:hypothetical protein